MIGVDAVFSIVNRGGILLQEQILKAALQCKVKRFIPSEYGADLTKAYHSFFSPLSFRMIPVFDEKRKLRKEIEESGIEYTYINTGFWYDTTFAPYFGFDIVNYHRVNFDIVGKE